MDFSHAEPVFEPPWSIVSAADKGTWRPGGQQVGAIHLGLGRLFVPMHRGGEGTHKDSGTEIWVFDLKSHQRLARWPIDVQQTGATSALQVTQDHTPLLFLAGEDGDLAVLDAMSGRLKHIEKHFSQTPWQLLSP